MRLKFFIILSFTLLSFSSFAFAAEKIVVRPLDGYSGEEIISMAHHLNVATSHEEAKNCLVANEILLAFGGKRNSFEQKVVLASVVALWERVVFLKKSNYELRVGLNSSLAETIVSGSDIEEVYKAAEGFKMACVGLINEHTDLLGLAQITDSKQ